MVRIIVGLAPGGATDIFARLIGQWTMHEMLMARASAIACGYEDANCGGDFLLDDRPAA